MQDKVVRKAPLRSVKYLRRSPYLPKRLVIKTSTTGKRFKRKVRSSINVGKLTSFQKSLLRVGLPYAAAIRPRVPKTIPRRGTVRYTRSPKAWTQRILTGTYPRESSLIVPLTRVNQTMNPGGSGWTDNLFGNTKLTVTQSNYLAGARNPYRYVQSRILQNASTLLTAHRVSTKQTPFNLYAGAFKIGSLNPLDRIICEVRGYFGNINVLQDPQFSNPSPDPVLLQKAQDEALRRLYKAINRKQHQFQGGVFLGELKKAVTMVVRPARTLQESMIRYIHNARKRTKDKLNTVSSRKLLSDLYLEATFGWQPLIADCRDAAKALARFNNPQFEKTRFKVGVDVEADVAGATSTAGLNVFEVTRPSHSTYKGSCIYYGAFHVGTQYPDQNLSKIDRFVKLSGFDLNSFAPTVWELIPFSFVVDYFSNVGDVILAHSTPIGQVKYLTRVDIQEAKNHLSTTCDAAQVSNQFGFMGYPSTTYRHVIRLNTTSCYRMYRSVQRVPVDLRDLPSLALRLELPGSDHWKQWLNLGVLISSFTSS